VSRYRSQSATLRTALWQGFSNAPVAILFFTGLSFHVMTALLAHVTSYNMSWAATKKDLEVPTIQEELPVVLKRHWLTFGLGAVVVAGIAILSTSLVPLTWQISEITIMFPPLWLAAGQCVLLFPPLRPPRPPPLSLSSTATHPDLASLSPRSILYPIILNPAIMLFRF